MAGALDGEMSLYWASKQIDITEEVKQFMTSRFVSEIRFNSIKDAITYIY